MSRRKIDRTEARPNPEDWADDDPMTLEEMAAVFSAKYPTTVSTLRLEIKRGRLTASKVSGAYWVTPANLKAFFSCPVAPKAPASISEKAAAKPAASPSPIATSSETERLKSAQAAARIAAKALAGRRSSLQNTSSQKLPAPLKKTRTTAAPAEVIPLRSM